MKINLLTIHYSLSCGAVLQTYSTCKVLESLGCDVTIINFKNPIELKRRRSLKYWLMNGIRKVKFDKFRKKYFPKQTLEMFYIDYSSLPEADCYMTGSDQIWNPKVVEENLPIYMLDFLPDGVKRISYASSFGVNKWDFSKGITTQAVSLLGKFSALSIRESSGVSICKNIFGLHAVQVLDPTLLIRDYSNLIGEVEQNDEIVCFKLVYDVDFEKSVVYLKNKLNLKSVLLYASYPHKCFDKNLMYCSPITWLRKFASAKLVLTDSFHGLAFALIFNKNFIVLGGMRDRTTRLLSLLELVGLTDRYIRNYDELIVRKDLLSESIDYKSVNKILEKARLNSFAYLKGALFGK